MTLNLLYKREAKVGVIFFFEIIFDPLVDPIVKQLWVIGSDTTWYGEGLQKSF